MTNRAVIVGINDYSQQQSLPPGWTVTDLVDPDDSGCYYEAMIPASGAPITDLDVYNLASALSPAAVNFTLILDSCHSGGIHEGTPDAPVTPKSASYSADYIQTCVCDMNTIIPVGVCLAPGDTDMANNVSNVVGQGNGVVCSVDDNKSLVPSSLSTVIAACRYDETAADGPHGALTQGLLDLITQSNPSISYSDLIDQLRNDLQNNLNATQTPTLLGQQNRMDDAFLAAWDQSQ